MNNREFSDNFDVLLNSYDSKAPFGDEASKQEISLNEYEKSVYLSMAQEDVLKSYIYNDLNPQKQGFDDSEKRQIDYSSLISVANIKAEAEPPHNSNSRYTPRPKLRSGVRSAGPQIVLEDGQSDTIYLPPTRYPLESWTKSIPQEEYNAHWREGYWLWRTRIPVKMHLENGYLVDENRDSDRSGIGATKIGKLYYENGQYYFVVTRENVTLQENTDDYTIYCKQGELSTSFTFHLVQRNYFDAYYGEDQAAIDNLFTGVYFDRTSLTFNKERQIGWNGTTKITLYDPRILSSSRYLNLPSNPSWIHCEGNGYRWTTPTSPTPFQGFFFLVDANSGYTRQATVYIESIHATTGYRKWYPITITQLGTGDPPVEPDPETIVVEPRIENIPTDIWCEATGSGRKQYLTGTTWTPEECIPTIEPTLNATWFQGGYDEGGLYIICDEYASVEYDRSGFAAVTIENEPYSKTYNLYVHQLHRDPPVPDPDPEPEPRPDPGPSSTTKVSRAVNLAIPTDTQFFKAAGEVNRAIEIIDWEGDAFECVVESDDNYISAFVAQDPITEKYNLYITAQKNTSSATRYGSVKVWVTAADTNDPDLSSSTYKEIVTIQYPQPSISLDKYQLDFDAVYNPEQVVNVVTLGATDIQTVYYPNDKLHIRYSDDMKTLYVSVEDNTTEQSYNDWYIEITARNQELEAVSATIRVTQAAYESQGDEDLPEFEDIDLNNFGKSNLTFMLPRRNGSSVTDVLVLLNERLTVRNEKTNSIKDFVIRPISYLDYDRISLKPYPYPLKREAWRLFRNPNEQFDVYSEIIPPYSLDYDIDDCYYRIRYVRRPLPIILTDLPDGLNIEGVSTETTCQLNPILHSEILSRAVELAYTTRVGHTRETTKQ